MESSNDCVKLSVLLPVYNPKIDWLRQSIDSVLNQTYKEFKLILIDDGSESAVHLVLDEYRKSDSRVTVIKNETNLGLVKSLNIGLEVANSEFVARMDADDCCFPDRFELQMRYLGEHPEISVLATEAIWMDTKEKLTKDRIVSHEDILSTLPFYCCITHPTVILRRKDILNIGGYPDVLAAEDYALWTKLVFSTNLKMEILPRVCLMYRRGDNYAKYGRRQKMSAILIRRYIYRSLIHPDVAGPFDDLPANDLEAREIDDICSILKTYFNANESLLRLNATKAKLRILKSNFSESKISFIEYFLRRIRLKLALVLMRGRI